MTRDLSTAIEAAIAEPVYRDIYLVSLDFSEGFERACTAPFSIWFDDEETGTPNEFLGVGSLGSVSVVEEGSDLRAYGVALTLTGCDPAQLALSLDSKYQGRTAKIWLGLLDENHTLIADPVMVFCGMMDTMPIELGKTGTVTVNVENALARWEQPNPENLRYTSADQQSRYPGDLGFEFSSIVPARELAWGKA